MGKDMKNDVMGALALETMDVGKQTLAIASSVKDKLDQLETKVAEVIQEQNKFEPQINKLDVKVEEMRENMREEQAKNMEDKLVQVLALLEPPPVEEDADE